MQYINIQILTMGLDSSYNSVLTARSFYMKVRMLIYLSYCQTNIINHLITSLILPIYQKGSDCKMSKVISLIIKKT